MSAFFYLVKSKQNNLDQYKNWDDPEYPKIDIWDLNTSTNPNPKQLTKDVYDLDIGVNELIFEDFQKQITKITTNNPAFNINEYPILSTYVNY